MLARDVMIDDVAHVTLDADLDQVARLLATSEAGAVVVVDAWRRPIGMVTRSNLMRAASEADSRPLPRWLVKKASPLAASPATSRLLREVMTTPAISVRDVAQLLEFAMLMERKQLKRLPVVNGDGLVGLLRRTDVLRALDDHASPVAPLSQVGSVTAEQFRELAAQAEAREQEQRAEAKRLAQLEREKIIEEMAGRRLSDRAWDEMLAGARRAAGAGLKEYVLLRFPAQLCADGGRAINAPDPHWPASLRGEARDVYERWRRELRPGEFQLAAQIVSFPNGMPGDAALILSWSA